MRRRISGQTESLARQFDRVLGLLESWGYLDGWSLTHRGEALVRLFHESDLLLAEVLEKGLFDDLAPAALAGLASCFTYEHRSPEPPPPPWFPDASLQRRFARIDQIARRLNEDERSARIPQTREPDPTFVPSAHAWAAGESLNDVLIEEEVSGGDFVRNIKQLIDLLRQIAGAASNTETSRAAFQAADALFRGVVAASSSIESSRAPAGPHLEGNPVGVDQASDR